MTNSPPTNPISQKIVDPTIDYDNLKHHPMLETITHCIADELEETENLDFFRLHVCYYFSMVASMMRAEIKLPNSRTDLISMFAVNLAPSGYGKGVSDRIMRQEVINQFSTNYRQRTWPIVTGKNMDKLAHKRSAANGTEFDTELKAARAEFRDVGGKVLFSFDKPTEAGLKQKRTMLLMAGLGSINLSTDEIAANLFRSKDAIDNFLTLYDGELQNSLIKHTRESARAEEYVGRIHANMMLFGVPSQLLEQEKTFEQFLQMLEYGYARRCYYCYVAEGSRNRTMLSPLAQLQKMKNSVSLNTLKRLSQQFGLLADESKVGQKLTFDTDALLTLFQFDNDSRLRGEALLHDNPYPTTETKLRVYEVQHRRQKVQRLAGAFAFVDNSLTVTLAHVHAAIKIAEESTSSFQRILTSEESHVKLAKYLGSHNQDTTQPYLIERLPFFKKASKVDRDNMITHAIAWGYTNNLLVKRRVTDGVEFIRGEPLKPTNLDEIIVSHSTEITEGYRSQVIRFDRLHTLCTADGHHWINHELQYGLEGQGYRHDDNVIAGFNCVVIDVDNGVPIEVAMRLMENYKALYYTTKRHTNTHHRFRIVLPTNYELRLNKEDFDEFMRNLFAWLPFPSDESTGQRSRKWMTFKGKYTYRNGQLLDVLPFIPKTTRQQKQEKRMLECGNLDSLERWFAMHTYDGNRNNHLLRYALILIDLGYTQQQINDKLLALNAALSKPMEEARIQRTIMQTVAKRIAAAP